MRYFDIYLIKEEVARLYLGKEDLLYRLFMEAKAEKNQQRLDILQKQIQYITAAIPIAELKTKLHKLPVVDSADDKIELNQEDSGIVKLKLNLTFIEIKVSGDNQAETVVFEALRRCFPHFFAVDYQNHYGAWLSPQKRHILHHRQLVL